MKMWRGSLLALFLVSALLTGCGSHPEGTAKVTGLWEASLEYPGLSTRIGFRIGEEPGGRLRVSLLRPDQTDLKVEASDASFDEPLLRMDFGTVDADFRGQFGPGDEEIRGTWRQGGRSWSIALVRVQEMTGRPRPQTPFPPYPYLEQEVAFEAGAGVRLAGTLTLPDDVGSFPAVLLISGTGGQDRDGTILQHRPFRVLADDLTRRGIAVLRCDDRGVGASTGDRLQATSADYAEDALAAVRFLRAHANVDPNGIGLVGHSEGGTIAMLAAAASPDVAFVVLLGTPGLPGIEYNLQCEESTARALGQSEAQIEVKLAFQKRVLAVVQRATDITAAREELRRIYRELPGVAGAQIDAAIDRLLSPWFRFNLAHAPSVTLAKVGCPVLAVFGELDVQVPSAGNLDAVRAALGGREVVNYQVVEMKNLNHFFQTAVTGSPLEYGEINETLAPEVMRLVGTWVLDHARP